MSGMFFGTQCNVHQLMYLCASPSLSYPFN